MYEGDYKYIEQLYVVALQHLPGDLQNAKKKYIEADIEGVRKAMHKIKTTFGFAGMIELQEECRQLEDKCSISFMDSIKPEIELLLKRIDSHALILQQEYEKLKKFNSQVP